jgi:hypothetical protein
MTMLDTSDLSVEQSPGGKLSVRCAGGQEYQDVFFVRLFPHSGPDHYISVRRKQGQEQVEIGIVKDLDSLPQSARQVVLEDMRRRTFLPLITDVVSIKTRRGEDTWVVETDKGHKTFTVREPGENVVTTDRGMVFITDSDKCRYKIPDYRTLPRRSRLLLEKTIL